MFLILLYSFLAGVITILSPCILPLLPIILSSSVSPTTSQKRPLGIIFGFIASFTYFTLFLSSIVQFANISPNLLRSFSITVIFLLGLSLLSARFQVIIEKLFSFLTSKLPNFDNGGNGFWSGFLVGLSLGLLWTPCVGPILASVIALAITGQVTLSAFFITLAYATGTAIPMLMVLMGGQTLFTKVPWLLRNTAKIQKSFGLITIFLAVALFQNWDRSFQTYILNKFPSYGANLTNFENSAIATPKLSRQGMAPEIIPGGDWFNSSPLKISELKGKVVLVDFWTYTCINCIRTLPYIKSWHQKYKKDGLVIIGVHSPEFEFEKDSKNVSKAIKDFNLEYPIVQDNNFSTWKAYKNNYWPAKYLIDSQGNIRYTHFGEGDYAETEAVIQNLLIEANPNLSMSSPQISDVKNYGRSPETYLGLGRGNYSPRELLQENKILNFKTPDNVSQDQVAFGGNYLFDHEFANPQSGSSLQYRFDAKDVYLVMSATQSSQVKVFVDNKVQYFGKDNQNGEVTVDSNRLYHIINLPEPGKHLLRLEFENNFTKLFAFTFG